jgi:hypothetical protein
MVVGGAAADGGTVIAGTGKVVGGLVDDEAESCSQLGGFADM